MTASVWGVAGNSAFHSRSTVYYKNVMFIYKTHDSLRIYLNNFAALLTFSYISSNTLKLNIYWFVYLTATECIFIKISSDTQSSHGIIWKNFYISPLLDFPPSCLHPDLFQQTNHLSPSAAYNHVHLVQFTKIVDSKTTSSAQECFQWLPVVRTLCPVCVPACYPSVNFSLFPACLLTWNFPIYRCVLAHCSASCPQLQP